MAPSLPAYDVDWVWCDRSNVHIASHPDWFTTFTYFESSTGGINGLNVLGIGDVELVVRKVMKGKGSRKLGIGLNKIVLHDVLYVPEAECNTVGAPLLADFDLSGTFRATSIADKVTGEVVADMDYVGHKKLWLDGQTTGRSSLANTRSPAVRIEWPDCEREMWEAIKATFERSCGHNSDSVGAPELTKGERKWLTGRCGSEAYFLSSHGLDVGDAHHRATGRAIARSLIKRERQPSEPSRGVLSSVLPYSAREKSWIAASCHRNEEDLLSSLGLDYELHQHRALGRLHIREYMESESVGGGLLAIEDDLQHGGRTDADLPPSPPRCSPQDTEVLAKEDDIDDEAEDKTTRESTGEQAPSDKACYFSRAEKAWMKEVYGDAATFLASNDLSVDSPGNRKESVAVVRRLMRIPFAAQPLWVDDDSDSEDTEQPPPAMKSFGQRMLERQGWTAGQGLGAAAAGIAEPLQVDKRHFFDKSGVGMDWRPAGIKRKPKADKASDPDPTETVTPSSTHPEGLESEQAAKEVPPATSVNDDMAAREKKTPATTSRDECLCTKYFSKSEKAWIKREFGSASKFVSSLDLSDKCARPRSKDVVLVRKLIQAQR